MKDIIYSKMGKIEETGATTVGIGGLAFSEYRDKYGCQKSTAAEKKIFGAVIETDDSINSLYNIIDTAIDAGSSVIMFDIQEATGKQIYHIRTYMRSKDKFEEISSLYETRVCFTRP
jgi:hypothetical protein